MEMEKNNKIKNKMETENEKRVKTGGRQVGTPNKTTKTVRELLETALNQELERLPIYLAELPINDRINLIIKLLPYIVPKYKDSAYYNDSGVTWNTWNSALNTFI